MSCAEGWAVRIRQMGLGIQALPLTSWVTFGNLLHLRLHLLMDKLGTIIYNEV